MSSNRKVRVKKKSKKKQQQDQILLLQLVFYHSIIMSKPSKDHWMGVKRVLRYLKGTLKYGLKFSAQEEKPELFGYTDADWAGDVDTRRSTSSYVFQIGSGTVSWSSRKQQTVAKSSTEAEYVALSSATQEAVWPRCLMKDLGKQMDASTTIYEDNQGTIELAKNAKFHNRTKHIDICHHFVRERVASHEIRVIYCPTEDMIADIMTKGFAKPTLEKLRDLLAVHDIMSMKLSSFRILSTVLCYSNSIMNK